MTGRRVTRYYEIEGDLIELALNGRFDVIAHGCNCFCKMGNGIAPLMAKNFGCDKYPLEGDEYIGVINKLGQIEYRNNIYTLPNSHDGYDQISFNLTVVNCYTQYYNRGNNPLGRDAANIDYQALELCLRKMNFLFKDKFIGLPKIGCGLAGGDWNIVSSMIQKEMKDCYVTIVNLK